MIKKLPFLFFIFISLLTNAQQSYYNDVDLNQAGVALKDALAVKITNTHTNFLSYTPGVWEASRVTDLDPNNSENVLLIYGYNDTDNNHVTDRSRDKDANGGTSGSDWNREHTYPRSLGNPNLGTSGPGADAHHLRPSDVDFNSDRGSLRFVSGSGNAGSTNGGWYPGDEWKGDIARMMMYMYLRYGDQCLPSVVGVGDNSDTPDDMIDLFLTWNAEDPVSQIEDNRNTYHENTTNQYAQGNRNPFIDNPNLATQIWGGPVAMDRWSGTVVVDTESPTTPLNLSTSNVTSDAITLSWNSATDNVGVISYQVFVNNVSYDTTGSTSLIIEDLDASTTYSMYVVARDAAGNVSENSSSTTATTLEEIIDNTEYCNTESFENIEAGSSSYSDRLWVGDNNTQWGASEARTDQSLSDGSKTIAIRRTGELFTTGAGGIKSFSVKTKRVFSGTSGTFDLNINGNKVGEIAYTDEEQTIEIDNINITGDIEIVINNNSTGDNRVIFDDLQWECYEPATASIDDLDVFKNIKIYPNPSNTGNVTVELKNNVKVTDITIYSIIGKSIISTKNPEFSNQKITIENLNRGVYLMKLSNNSSNITKKLVIN